MDKIRENTINFETVFTKEDFLTLSNEEVEFAKKEGTYHANYLRSMFSGGILIELLGQRSREIAYLSHKYRGQNDTTKELLAATIAFPDDEKLIKFLISKDITYNQLAAYSKAVTSVKKITILAKKVDVDDSITVASKKINKLCLLFKRYSGISDFNLILAKINEIVIFKKDLYKMIEDDQFKKKH